MTQIKIMEFWGETGRPSTQLLLVTVDRCYNLENRGAVETEYSCVLEYGGSLKRTKPCLGGGRHPVFEETVVFEFAEGVLELNIWVLTGQPDRVIGFLRVQLQRVLSGGSMDWNLHTTDGRPAGNIRLKLQFPSSSSTFQHQNSSYAAPTLDSASPLEPQPAILYQLLPYDSLPPSPAVPRPNAPYPYPYSYPPNYAPTPQPLYPPTQPTQPNATGPAALWAQLLPSASSYTYTSTPAPAVPLPYDVVPYPPTHPMSYCPPTCPPPGYGYPLQPHYLQARPGPSSDVYPPPPH